MKNKQVYIIDENQVEEVELLKTFEKYSKKKHICLTKDLEKTIITNKIFKNKEDAVFELVNELGEGKGSLTQALDKVDKAVKEQYYGGTICSNTFDNGQPVYVNDLVGEEKIQGMNPFLTWFDHVWITSLLILGSYGLITVLKNIIFLIF